MGRLQCTSVKKRNEVKNHETHTMLQPHDELVLEHGIPRPLCCILYRSTISALNIGPRSFRGQEKTPEARIYCTALNCRTGRLSLPTDAQGTNGRARTKQHAEGILKSKYVLVMIYADIPNIYVSIATAENIRGLMLGRANTTNLF